MATSPLVLASTSPRRRELLAGMGLSFDVVGPTVAEPIRCPACLEPADWAEALAYFKARSVADARPEWRVLGGDTVVACAGELLGKPRNRADAARMLELQAGAPGDVVTGVCLLCPLRNAVVCDESLQPWPRRLFARAITRVWMRNDRAARQAYLDSGDWEGKAGAYGIQDVGDRLVERIEGDFDNVVGLPCRVVRTLLEIAGKCGT
ncbi:MAG: septum formation protein Maf [Planctomycetes bacterium]|nr:septum formation protein Maf [Planctomycetota bacterium]